MTVGQKVVCLDDKFPDAAKGLYTALPVKGFVYVIREIRNCCDSQGKLKEVCVYLVGLNNPHSTIDPFPERGFNGERFRLLSEVRTRESETAANVIGTVTE